jgi:hypothetical protein
MGKSAKVAPLHSLILIVDPSGGEIPATMSGSLIASTDSCIAVGCRSDVDGDTEFTLGETGDVSPGSEPAFQGRLKTPNRRVTLRTVTGQTILETPLLQQETMVRVWTNDPSEPDQVVVGIG